MLPVVVWAALRFSQREVARLCLLLSGVAIWGIRRGFGPVASGYSKDSLLVLQAFVGIIALTCLSLAAAVYERREIERDAGETNAKLWKGLNELERRNYEIVTLNELGDLLHSCLTVEEAYPVLTRYLPLLFPEQSGALYNLSTSKNLVESRIVWGPEPPAEGFFLPNDCWALRRGQVHIVTQGSGAQNCAHYTAEPLTDYICKPLIAQGEILVVLHVRGNARRAKPQEQLAEAIGDTAALALANLKLSESLREQSIRDPLTGLFNRRYLEEALERELSRAARNRDHGGLIMLAIDNFKRFNDTFGHGAVDQFLRELGGLLKRSIRGGDIACRYGGEEFLILLPAAPL